MWDFILTGLDPLPCEDEIPQGSVQTPNTSTKGSTHPKQFPTQNQGYATGFWSNYRRTSIQREFHKTDIHVVMRKQDKGKGSQATLCQPHLPAVRTVTRVWTRSLLGSKTRPDATFRVKGGDKPQKSRKVEVWQKKQNLFCRWQDYHSQIASCYHQKEYKRKPMPKAKVFQPPKNHILNSQILCTQIYWIFRKQNELC